MTTDFLQQSYQTAYQAEDATWKVLTEARSEMLAAAAGKVPSVTIQKWMSEIEGKPRLDTLSPGSRKILENLSAWCGSENLSRWIKASRDFSAATDHAFRAAMELKAGGGIKSVIELDGTREDGELRRKLISIATRINPTVELHLVRELYAEGPALLNSGASSTDRMEVAGMHVPYYNMSTVSLSKKFDPVDTVYHEMWHSIEPVLTHQERAALRSAFPGDHVMTHEERTAVAFANWATIKERAPNQQVSRSFHKVNAAAAQIKSLFGGRRVEAIFHNAFAGELGERMVKGFRKLGGRDHFLPVAAKIAKPSPAQIVSPRPRKRSVRL
tara:strand:- start:35128 stop:36111 length:984 start_codon:yes stop_codon:yes gene_type:complete